MDKLRGVVAKIFLVVLFGLLIVSFAVWGIGDIFRGRVTEQVVAEVGERRISQAEFSRALASDVSRIQQQLGQRLDPDVVRAFGLPQQALDRLITQALYSSLATELGMVATNAQVREAIVSSRLFQTPTGEFDRFRFEQVLRASQMSEGEYIALLRQELQREQIVSAVTAGVAVPEALVRRLHAFRAEKRRGDYITIPESAIDDLPEPGEEALKELYDREEDRYLSPEYRRLAFLHVDPQALYPQIAVAEDELRAAFEERKAEFARPEQRGIEQILFSGREDAEAAYARLQDGEDFESVAQSTTGEPPVRLGQLARAELLPQIGEVAFALDPGRASAPVESDFGWHIVRVLEIEPAYDPTFEEISETLRRNILHRHAVEAAIELANRLDDLLGGGATLEEAAKELDLPLRTVPAIDRAGLDPEGREVENLPPGGSFPEVAFSTERGSESLLQETDEGGYYVLRVEEVTPAAPRPFEAVRTEVRNLWIAEERASRARSRAEAIEARLAEGRSLAEVAAAEGLETRSSPPVTRFDREPSPEFASVLFELEVGRSAVVAGPEGPLVAVLQEIVPAEVDGDAAGLEEVREDARRALIQDLLGLTGAELQRHFRVTVNQAQIDQALASY